MLEAQFEQIRVVLLWAPVERHVTRGVFEYQDHVGDAVAQRPRTTPASLILSSQVDNIWWRRVIHEWPRYSHAGSL